MKSYNTIKKQFLQDKKIKQAYDSLEPEFLLAKQSTIARLESGRYNPSPALLEKVAIALDAQLSISIS